MTKNIIPIVERLFSLLVVFLLLAATALWSGKFLGKDWLRVSDQDKIVQVTVKAPNFREMTHLGLKGKTLVPYDSVSWRVVDQEQTLGIVMSSMPFTEKFTGYAGVTPLFVYIDEAGLVKGVAAMENDETPRFFRRAAHGILHQWDNLGVSEALETEVDAVTGATYTSLSLVGNVKAVLSAYAETDLMAHKEPAIGWVRTIALFVVFAIGLIVVWRFRGRKWIRLSVMVLNVVVTGFWCGQFLSLSILHGWVENGVDIMLYLPTFVMLVIAIVMPYLGKPNHYCNWMCPYGSLQELAWLLPLPKVKVGAKTYKRMAQIRMWVLMLLLAALWMGFGFSLMDYEPFTAFIVNSAAPTVMVLAGAFVVAGIFIPHPWCRCVCPVGTLLNLAEEKK